MVLTYLIHSSTMLNTYDIHNKVISAHSRTIQNNQNHISISAKKESITKCTPHWVVSYFDNHNPIKLMPCPSARTKLFLSRTKWKLSWTKSFLSEAKKSFFIQFITNDELFIHVQNFLFRTKNILSETILILSRTKIILSGQMDWALLCK